MKKVVLQSMTDHSDYLDTLPITDAEKWQLHCKRKKFGKQSLQLWMFVPCEWVDGKWIPLEEPAFRYKSNDDRWGTSIETDEWKEYEQAKERALFEGFELVEGNLYHNRGYCSLEVRHGKIYYDGDDVYLVEDIEQLSMYFNDIVLTPTALKQLELWQR